MTKTVEIVMHAAGMDNLPDLTYRPFGEADNGIMPNLCILSANIPLVGKRADLPDDYIGWCAIGSKQDYCLMVLLPGGRERVVHDWQSERIVG